MQVEWTLLSLVILLPLAPLYFFSL